MKKHVDPPLLREVRAYLNAHRDEWDLISQKSGCPLPSLKKIAHGHTRDPGIGNVEKLRRQIGIGIVLLDGRVK